MTKCQNCLKFLRKQSGSLNKCLQLDFYNSDTPSLLFLFESQKKRI